MRCVLTLSVVFLFASTLRADEPKGPLADKLKDVKFEQYAEAPGYSEGPSWRKGEVFFCSGALLRVDAKEAVHKYLELNPAGTVLRGDGHLLVVDNKYKAVLAVSPEGKVGVIADRWEGQTLRSLNDLTVDARGNIYWTDPEGSTPKTPVGSIFRVRPDGRVDRIGTGLAFPNGLDVDPAGKYLYVIESQSKKVLRYVLPPDDQPLGKAEVFFDLGGSGGDGCVFDAAGNFWVADFHRPDTKHGRITVLSPEAKVLATLDVPAEVVSNITFGGPDNDEIFCTTGNPAGVFHARVGVKGFKGHPGKPGKIIRQIHIPPTELASPVHPRRFGQAEAVESIRGWYIWKKWNADTWEAEVVKESTGEVYKTRMLPWATTYRYLVYGASPNDLLPGERVNVFFAADENHPRGYVVHFQDELCQMKGHGHSWEIRSVTADGNGFTARGMAGDKPLDDKDFSFQIDPKCQKWSGGKLVEKLTFRKGDRVYLTWCPRDDKRIVLLVADNASLDAVKKGQEQHIDEQVAVDGLGGRIEGIEGKTVQLMVFAPHWAQAGRLKPGDEVSLKRSGKGFHATGEAVAAKVVSAKNRGTYGSGVNDMVLELKRPEDAKVLPGWTGESVIRLIPAR